MNISRAYSLNSPTQRCAWALTTGLRQELDLTPKPGLVDRNNSGSHDDLSYELMSRSIDLLELFFCACVKALESGDDIRTVQKLGVATEKTMLQQFRTNTHRGVVFLGGILLAGVHEAGDEDCARVESAIAAQARRLFAERLPTGTTGALVRARFHVGGIITEALNGLPSVFNIGVPALERGRSLAMPDSKARLLALAMLMQSVEDTTALRRCGTLGLISIRADGQCLEKLLLEGETPYPFLTDLDQRYRARRLTMGGIADLLAVSLAWHHRNELHIIQKMQVSG